MKLSFGQVVAYVTILLFVAYGWVWNIIDIAHTNLGAPGLGGLVILRIAGIFVVPLGAVLGYV